MGSTLESVTLQAADELPQATQTKSFSVRLGTRGRVVIPPAIQEKLEVKPGDRLIWIMDENGGVRLVSLFQQIDKACGMYKDLAPGVSLADELIAERREEARREELE